LSDCIVFYPDYSGGNPYQKLLYQSARDCGWIVKSGTIESAINLQSEHETVIFNLHWLNIFFRDCRSDEVAWKVVNDFCSSMREFQNRGGKVFWTIHNHSPHENTYYEQDLRLRYFLAANADNVHLHCASHLKELCHLNLDPTRVTILRHGHYINAYGPFHPRDRLKQIDENGKKALFLGSIRGYKSINRLLHVVLKLRSLGVDVTVAGSPETPSIKREIEEALQPKGVNLLLRRLTSDEVHEACLLHNIGILSYDRILTSGSLKLCQSYGMAIVAPKLSTIVVQEIMCLELSLGGRESMG